METDEFSRESISPLVLDEYLYLYCKRRARLLFFDQKYLIVINQ